MYALLLLTTLLWGAGPVAGKIALQGIPTITVGMLRFGLTSLLLSRSRLRTPGVSPGVKASPAAGWVGEAGGAL